jgi:hypothetical protein
LFRINKKKLTESKRRRLSESEEKKTTQKNQIDFRGHKIFESKLKITKKIMRCDLLLAKK